MKETRMSKLFPNDKFKLNPESEKEYVFLGAYCLMPDEGNVVYCSYRAGESGITGFYSKNDKIVYIY